MYAFKVRYRYPSGSWGETIIMARNNYEASQQAYATFGQANVLAVWMDNY
jgi:hypothetical protein